ncbi:hypothetical protein [Streptomyces sp. NBC_00859]|uniref:hypothetical protein n=1 Tax=Streptomyces sp. NBC_00859 TaxID=2903682 RepID=UPI00386F682F|nr:hypothetical protein OG584_16050 [Streptomyces sp. NBC_00859]
MSGPAPAPQGPAAVGQGGAPVRRGVDGQRFSGVAEAFAPLPVQRAVTAQAALPAGPVTGPAVRHAPIALTAPSRPAGSTAVSTARPAAGAPSVPAAAPGTGAVGTDTTGGPAAPVVTLGRTAAAPAPSALPVQRAPGTPARAPKAPSLLKPATPAPPQLSAVTVTAQGTGSGAGNGGGAPPPPYTESAESPPPYSAVAPNLNNGPRCDGSTEEAAPRFDARDLSDGQVDELTHRLVGPLTRLLRTELRMDRERIGRLRDPRR